MLAFVDQPDQYLEHSEYVDWQEPAVLEAAKSLAGPGDEAATAKNVFYFVRDEIAHSWDAQLLFRAELGAHPRLVAPGVQANPPANAL